MYPLKNGVVDFLTSLPLTKDQQKAQNTFNAVSTVYDNEIVRHVESLSCPWSTYTAKLEAFMAHAGGKVILDVACGTSFPVGPFVPPTSIYLGMDISLDMLGHAKSLLGDNLNVALWNIDVERIPLPDNCVDLCLSLMAFNVFSDPQKAAEEIHRVIKKDGSLYGTIFTQQPPEEILSERPMEPGRIREILSVFDPSSWDLTIENEGGVVFFLVKKLVKT